MRMGEGSSGLSFPEKGRMQFVDDHNRRLDLAGPPQRIVSLVPSLTETLFALGAGSRVVGVTKYCTHPPDGVAALPKVGGTKNPDPDAIDRLAPDLVLVNDEENRIEDFRTLEAHGWPVYVTAPRGVADGIRLVERLGPLIGCPEQAGVLAASLRRTYRAATRAQATHRPLRVFCPIWRKPWMSFNGETYCDDMLRCSGGENVLRAKTDRYFRLTLDEVVAADPEVVLLPSEPYPFTERHFVHLEPLRQTSAGRAGHFYCIDGMAFCWHGPRIADGLTELSRLFASVRTS